MSDAYNPPSLSDLGYQMVLVWQEIARLQSWQSAFAYVDRLYDEARAKETFLWYYADDVAEDVRAHMFNVAAAAIDEVIEALRTEKELIRELAADAEYDPKALSWYLDRTADSYRQLPGWARVLRRHGALKLSFDPDRPYVWLWQQKDLIGLKPHLGDQYSWSTFAGMFYFRGKPVSPQARHNVSVATNWNTTYPNIIEEILG
jgi:hypothetical protein